jgi:hypothetical protein
LSENADADEMTGFEPGVSLPPLKRQDEMFIFVYIAREMKCWLTLDHLGSGQEKLMRGQHGEYHDDLMADM